MDRAQAAIEVLLFGTAMRIAGSHGWPVETRCEQLLREQAGKGAKLVAAALRAGDLLALARAEAAVGTLLVTMMEEAQQMGMQELHEPTLFQALRRLCPLFPFC